MGESTLENQGLKTLGLLAVPFKLLAGNSAATKPMPYYILIVEIRGPFPWVRA